MTRGLMYRGGLSTKTSARLAGAILKEFGQDDGLAILDWLIERIQAPTEHPITKAKEEANNDRRKRSH